MGFHLGMAAGLEAAARPVAASTLWPLRLLPEHLAHHDRRTSLSPELQRKALLTVLIGALVLARSFDRAGWNGRTTRGRLSGLGNRALFEDGAKWRKPAETGGNPLQQLHSRNPSQKSGSDRRFVSGPDWRIACGNCGNPHDEFDQEFVSALGNLSSRKSGSGSGNCAKCGNSLNPPRNEGRKENHEDCSPRPYLELILSRDCRG